jgi:hypothetical protein
LRCKWGVPQRRAAQPATLGDSLNCRSIEKNEGSIVRLHSNRIAAIKRTGIIFGDEPFSVLVDPEQGRFPSKRDQQHFDRLAAFANDVQQNRCRDELPPTATIKKTNETRVFYLSPSTEIWEHLRRHQTIQDRGNERNLLMPCEPISN